MKHIGDSRFWQIEAGATLAENIRMAVDYYAAKYGEEFDAVLLRPGDRALFNADSCCGLRLISDTQVTPGHIALARKNGRKG